MTIVKLYTLALSCAVLILGLSVNAYGGVNSAMGIPVQVLNSDWNGEICLSDGIQKLYAPMPVSGKADMFSYSEGQSYQLKVMCQPKTENCAITSGASGIVRPGMSPVTIACTRKVPEKSPGMNRTYTWALNNEFNTQAFPLLSSLPVGRLGDEYLPPATVPLASADQSAWLGDGAQKPPAQLRDFSLLYRTTSSTVPFSYGQDTSSYFNNWALIRELIAFGGDTSAGAQVIAPHAGWVNAAHRAGVRVYGTVFIGQDNKYTGLTDVLLGRSECPDMDDNSSCNYIIPTIDKLTALATTLKLDGWFLNIEAGLDDADSVEGRARINHLRRLMSYKFPEIKTSANIEFKVYSNIESLSLPGLVKDSMIANFGVTAPDDHSLDNATGLAYKTIFYGWQQFRPGNPQPYLMYLDEPYTRNTALAEEYPSVRIDAARQTQCQYFNGIPDSVDGTFHGLKQYTLAKYPTGADTRTLLCGGNTSAPLPSRVIKVTLANNTSVRLNNGAPCTNDNAASALWTKTCMFDVDANVSTVTLSFTGDNVSMAPLSGRRFGQLLIPLVGAKWWNLFKNSGDNSDFSVYEYVLQGLNTYDCEATSAGSTSCTVSLPPADDKWNIGAGWYGSPRLLNFYISAAYYSFIWGPRP